MAEEGSNEDAAGETSQPLQPCGRAVCGCIDTSPRTEPPARPDAKRLAELDNETAVAWEKRYDDLDDRLLHHECSHAI
jgi:hypothetical protein